jgi:hypothetical protein
MTERPVHRAPRRRRPSGKPIVVISLAAFFAVLALLAFQMRSGHDPALSASATATQARQSQQRVVVREVDDDYVITRVIPAASPGATPAPPLTTGSSGGSHASAPAPAAVVAPAPAPAPVTRTS